MLSWPECRDWQPVPSMKLTMGDQYRCCLYLNIQRHKEFQTMNGEPETETAEKHDEELSLRGLAARLRVRDRR